MKRTAPASTVNSPRVGWTPTLERSVGDQPAQWSAKVAPSVAMSSSRSPVGRRRPASMYDSRRVSVATRPNGTGADPSDPAIRLSSPSQ